MITNTNFIRSLNPGKKNQLIFILKIFFSNIIGLTVPLFIYFFLKAEGPVLLVLLLVFITNVLFILRKIINGVLKNIIAAALILIYFISALIVIIYILIIPFGAYTAWISLIKLNKGGGIISFLFVVGTAYFSSFFAGLFYSYNILKPISGIAFLIAFEASVIYQNVLLGVISSLIIIISLFFLAVFPNRKNIKSILYLFLLAAAVIIISGLISLNNPPNSGFLVGRYLHPKLKKIILKTFGNMPLLTEASGHGHFFDVEKLGDKPILINKNMFKIEGLSGQTVYIRTEVFDQYDENSWTHSFHAVKKSRENKKSLFSESSGENYLKLTVLADYYQIVPHILSCDNIVIMNNTDPSLNYGSLETGFYLTEPLLKNEVITIVKNKTNKKKKILINQFNKVVKEKIGRTIETQNYDPTEEQIEVLEEYLLLPVTIPDSVKNLAERLSRDKKTEYEILYSIYEYLYENYIYTLDTKIPDDEKDFVEDFLFYSKKGYSIHFTTAFIILARINGIPARYVTGFLGYIPDGYSETTVTGLQAHSWPEVWIDNIGWVALESTPIMDPRYFTDPSYYKKLNRLNDDLTDKQLKAMMQDRIPYEEKEKAGIKINYIKLLSYILLIIPFLILFFIIRIFIKLYKNRSRLKGRAKKIQKILNRMSRMLDKKRISPPFKTGWINWGERLGLFIPYKKIHIKQMIKIINKIFYSEYKPEEKDVVFVKKFYKMVGKKD